MLLCKHCHMPVEAATARCPRCRRLWPALTLERLRPEPAYLLFAILLAAGLLMMWWAAADLWIPPPSP
jgi:hypothetical protein